ncbi:MAG: sodium:solute symporter [Chitinophagaceae bacterium]|nr:MAG: sodium:solute symporter [Chitinophagaceae bacterium]
MIATTDIIIAAGYILLILLVGLWAGRKTSRGNMPGSANEYFLAGKSLKWPAIGLALFATNISTVHLVSLAQSGFDSGLLNGNFEWMAAFTLILLALFFAPFYIRSGVSTLPDFLEKRYDRACRDWLTIISLASAVIIHIAFSMLAGGIVLKTLFNVDMYTSVIIISLVTGLYTITGGLKAVVITESIQTVVLVAGALVISYVAYKKIGGWSPMVDVLTRDGELQRLSMLRPAGDSSGMPWYAVFLGYPILGIWYWCADQTIVQRVLGAKDLNHARVGVLFCGFIKILPVFIFVLPGLMAFALYRTGSLDLSSITSMDGSGNAVVQSKGIYTLMITQLLPVGLVGVLVAALLSGLMSQISGALNSISTMISYDVYKRTRPQATDRQLVFAGKVSAVIALLFSLLLLPLLNRYESIFNGLNDIIAHLAPPITCVFVLGIFWGKASARSARYTLWIGSALGATVFITNKLLPQNPAAAIPFMMMAFYLFCICLLMQVLLSFAYPAVHQEGRETYFWKSFYEPLRIRGWRGIGNYKVLTLALLVSMTLLFYLFR